MYTSGSTFIKKNPFSVIILVCLGNTQKTREQDELFRHWFSWCILLIVVDELGPFHQYLHQISILR